MHLRVELFLTSLSNHPYWLFVALRHVIKKGKGSPYLITERRVPSWSRSLAVSLQVTWIMNPAVGCHYFLPGLQLPPQPCFYEFCCLVNRGTMGVNSLPKTVTRQCRGCDLNPGHTAPESSTLTTRLPSHRGVLLPKIKWESVDSFVINAAGSQSSIRSCRVMSPHCYLSHDLLHISV